MANLILRKSSKDIMVGRSKPDIRCKKHPKHKQSPGVCSICLREKLFVLSSTSSSSRGYSTTMESSSSSSSLSSYYSSSASSACSSPMHRYDRFTTEGKNSLSSLLFGSKNVLTKSRSLILVPRMKNNKDSDCNGKKKSWFLSKLLGPRSKKTEEFLVHSRTQREIRV